MVEPVSAPSQHLLFDLNGQQVAVTDCKADSSGRLRMTWVILGNRIWSDEQTDQMLAEAFKFLFATMEKTPDDEEPVIEEVVEPEPDLNLPIWRTILHKLKELW